MYFISTPKGGSAAPVGRPIMTATNHPQQATTRRVTRHLGSPPTLEQVEQLGARAAQAQERLTRAKEVEGVAHQRLIRNGCDQCVRRYHRAIVLTDHAQQDYDAVHPVWVQAFVDWLVGTVEDEPHGRGRR